MQHQTSNTKQAKYMRKLYRKQMASEAHEVAKQLGAKIGNSIKPRPKWIPESVWMFFLKFFIRMK